MEIKTKPNRLLIYTKTPQDYNIVLNEIKTANLEYHTYPLPESRQSRLVLKGIPPNVPTQDIQEALANLHIFTSKIQQISKIDKITRETITKYPTFVITFLPGTDKAKVLQVTRLCHCIVKWEKYKNTRPIQQCYNCQAFGHSSQYCGKQAKCVKCDQPHPTKNCTKSTDTAPKCTNCKGPHPANFTGCPIYIKQVQNLQQSNRRSPSPRQTTKQAPSLYSYHQTQFPVIKNTTPPPPQQLTWAQVTSQTNRTTPPPTSPSITDSIKFILTLFDYQKLFTQLRSLQIQLQSTSDPITKLISIIDTIISCFSTPNPP